MEGKVLVIAIGVGVLLTAALADRIFVSRYYLRPSQAALKVRNGALLLDVRSRREFDTGHIAGARNVPVSEIEAHVTDLQAYREGGVVTYCASGHRAGLAVRKLRGAGLANAWTAGAFRTLRNSFPADTIK